MNIVVKITRSERANPPGKLADVELPFAGGELDGLKLIGFSVWEKGGGNGRSVTFPSRQYVAAGQRRTFALLRPIVDVREQERVRNLVEAYAQSEKTAVKTE